MCILKTGYTRPNLVNPQTLQTFKNLVPKGNTGIDVSTLYVFNTPTMNETWFCGKHWEDKTKTGISVWLSCAVAAEVVCCLGSKSLWESQELDLPAGGISATAEARVGGCPLVDFLNSVTSELNVQVVTNF